MAENLSSLDTIGSLEKFVTELGSAFFPKTKTQQPTLPLSDSAKIQAQSSQSAFPPNGDEISSADPVTTNKLTDNKHSVVNKVEEKKKRNNTLLFVVVGLAAVYFLKGK
jgi:hypothetical protein